MKKINSKYVYMGIMLACIIAIVVSFFPLGNHFSNPETYKETITSLDEKQKSVMSISTIAVTSSAAVSALPGDTGSPIADKLMDLSTIALGVLSVIVLEKNMVTILGYTTFKILIPIGLLCILLFMITTKRFFVKCATKLILFGLALFLLIPTSEKVSSFIETTYQVNTSIVEQTSEEIEEKEDKNFIESLLDSGKEKVDEMVESTKQQFNELLESLAISIVTNCLIPILVVIFFLYLIKLFLGIDINVPIEKMRHRFPN